MIRFRDPSHTKVGVSRDTGKKKFVLNQSIVNSIVVENEYLYFTFDMVPSSPWGDITC